MKSLHIILFIFIALAVSLSCEKEEVERPFARVQTLPVTEIDSTGATFHAEILSFHKDGITEYGFMWYNGILNRVWDAPERFSHIALGTVPSEKRFTARVETGFVPGDTYQVRAYLRSADWVVYGEPMLFASKGGQQPVIDKISPDIVVPGDTLLISGKYFASSSNDLTVTIGGTTAEIIASDLNQIKCIVPRYVNDNATIQVRSQSNKAPAIVQMPTIAKPEIYSLSANEVAVGDTLTLKGKYFSPQKNWNEIKTNNGGNFQIIRYFPDSLQFVVNSLSAVASDYQLFVEVGVRRSENQATFTMAAPIIEDFFPKTGGYGDTITFVGDKFHPDAQSNMVRFAEFGYFRVLESNRRSLKVFMREIPLGTDTERSAPFSISIANQTTVTSESFKYVNRDWSFISDLPGGQNHNPPGFTIQNTLYLNTGQPGEWWSYNIQSRNWRLQSRTPAGDGNFLTKEALTIGNEGFIIQRKENSNDSLFFLGQTHQN